MAVNPERLANLRRLLGCDLGCIYPVRMRNVPPEYLPEALEIRNEEIHRLFKHLRRVDEEHRELQGELNGLRVDVRCMIAERDRQGPPELRSGDGIRMDEALEEDLLDSPFQIDELWAEELLISPAHSELILLQTEIEHLNTKFLAEIEWMRKEVLQARSAADSERVARIEAMEQKQDIEKELDAMAREVEKLRAEVANMGCKARNNGEGNEAMEKDPSTDVNGIQGGAEEDSSSAATATATANEVEGKEGDK